MQEDKMLKIINITKDIKNHSKLFKRLFAHWAVPTAKVYDLFKTLDELEELDKKNN